MNPEEALKHPWILELKKKSSKEIRPKHRIRREAETSIEHENTSESLDFAYIKSSNSIESKSKKIINLSILINLINGKCM